MNPYIVIAALGFLVILSYLFNVLSRRSHIPSVLLLLVTGILAQSIIPQETVGDHTVDQLVQLLGVAGLVMIVLEASLDLKITPEKLPIIRDAFLSAVVILVVTCALVSIVLHLWLTVSWWNCLVYAIPVSIISSAIAIPSATNLPVEKKEFVIYESSLSDILGILLFNFITLHESFGAGTILSFGTTLLIVLIASLAATVLLVWLAGAIKLNVRYFLLLAILFLLYSTGKLLHLPSLILVMTFGIAMNNIDIIHHPWIERYFNRAELAPIISQFVSVTAETSFLLRTFFFILFGFSISLVSLLDVTVVAIGASILIVLVLVRAGYFTIFLRAKLFPEVLLMPRGLITVLLFYSIPERFQLMQFDRGILFAVIVGTTLLMTFGLMYYQKNGRIQLNDEATKAIDVHP